MLLELANQPVEIAQLVDQLGDAMLRLGYLAAAGGKTYSENLTRSAFLSVIVIYVQPAWPRRPTDQYLTALYTFSQID